MHSAELNVPQNHVYLFKPQSSISAQNAERGKSAAPAFFGIILTCGNCDDITALGIALWWVVCSFSQFCV